ncbi:MAG: hypothetical protein N4A40_12770 [Tissierellales bacterium]|nr:hypothetical protein [Tissierellales bacterium]
MLEMKRLSIDEVDDYLEKRNDIEYLPSGRSEKYEQYFLFTEKNVDIGFLAIDTEEDKFIDKICHFEIFNGFRRTGYGTKAVKLIIENFGPIIEATPANTEAEIFWLQCGFKESSGTLRYYIV